MHGRLTCCRSPYSPFAYVDPLHCNMAYLYLELLKDSLNEYAYAAELAGLNYDLQNTIYGMYVSIQPHASIILILTLPLASQPRWAQKGSNNKGIVLSLVLMGAQSVSTGPSVLGSPSSTSVRER